ncbi:hypothetical protein BAUCODRAFT_147284 [Baudoinia panamericana UAMH 10762]|uniref:Uncharacterized protein n=1 Tax=Baudoinia panamericana (strain UAMH 10762) TaxID=717646 RepID=M2ND49_BAUPA|nr:uncharacterized protein BAUCODRAFT_147284 [Baudoinia panamericana UAMH 10762]EMC97129.1 hypothetical protein BAUCODRAFT_147284 [Baudoinia panamericana UAMH 10762]
MKGELVELEDKTTKRQTETTPSNALHTSSSRRGRPAKHLGSSAKRTKRKNQSHKLKARKPMGPRKQITPTTKKDLLKERAYGRYARKRTREQQEQAVLRKVETYFRVLRDGKKYRSLGGVRR